MNEVYGGECKEVVYGINNEIKELKKGQEILGVNVDKLYAKLDFLLIPSNPPSPMKEPSTALRPASLLVDDIISIKNVQSRINEIIEEIVERLDV